MPRKKATGNVPDVMNGWKMIEDHTPWSEDFWRKEMEAGRINIKVIGRRVILTRREYERWLAERPPDNNLAQNF